MKNTTKNQKQEKEIKDNVRLNCVDILYNINWINGCSSKSGLNISFCLVQQLRNNSHDWSNFTKGDKSLKYLQI